MKKILSGICAFVILFGLCGLLLSCGPASPNELTYLKGDYRVDGRKYRSFVYFEYKTTIIQNLEDIEAIAYRIKSSGEDANYPYDYGTVFDWENRREVEEGIEVIPFSIELHWEIDPDDLLKEGKIRVYIKIRGREVKNQVVEYTLERGPAMK